MDYEKSQLVSKESDKVYESLNEFHIPPEKHCDCHLNQDETDVDSTAKRKLIYTSVLCIIFVTVEAIGGYLANSLAIATDAAHLLTDFVGFMISLFSIYLSSKPASNEMSYGWKRAQVIGAFISIILIWIVAGVLVAIAIGRLIRNNDDVDASIMVITATFGVFVNIIMGVVLQCTGIPHSHSHSHSHGDSYEKHENKQTNINVKAAFIHILGDLLQNIGVLIASLLIYFYPNLAFIDPICTLTFAIIVLFTTVFVLRDILNVLLEATPKRINLDNIKKSLFDVQGVVQIHDVHVWSINMEKVVFSAHLTIDDINNYCFVLKTATNKVKNEFNIKHVTIQVENFTEAMKQCAQCLK